MNKYELEFGSPSYSERGGNSERATVMNVIIYGESGIEIKFLIWRLRFF
jgi:hypothetical protein